MWYVNVNDVCEGALESRPLKQNTERTSERSHSSVLFPKPNPGQSVSASSSPVHDAPSTQNGVLLSSREIDALCRQIYHYTSLQSIVLGAWSVRCVG